MILAVALAAIGTATPASVGGGGETTQLQVTVTPDADSTGIAVTCDLSLIGDPAMTLHDDGLHADGAADDLVFGLVAITGDGVPFGPRTLPCSVSDAQLRTADVSIDVTIIPVCGDGLVTDGETCDDYGTETDDGCDADCLAEAGWICAGEPSDCLPACGDGLVVGAEECDDGSHTSGDGCTITCAREPGWECAGEPSDCEHVGFCGDGVIDAAEECDDLEPAGDDGCDATCVVEEGYACDGEPSICVGPSGRAPHDDDGDGVHDALDPCPDDPEDRCDDPAPEDDAGCCGASGDGSIGLALLLLLQMKRRPRGRR